METGAEERLRLKINQMAPKKQQWLIILLVGILLVVIAFPTEEAKEEKSAGKRKEEKNSARMDYEAQMEEKLKKTLQYVSGVGKTEVMITLKSTAEKVIEKDMENTNRNIKESDDRGGERTTGDSSFGETTIYEGGNENQRPYIKKEMTPELEGVVVIAEGGGNPETVKNITEAVQALFNVDTHKIKIMKMNEKKAGGLS